jgi:thioredoxin 1
MSDIPALSRDLIPPVLHENKGPVFVDVWGPQCAPCMALAPAYEKLAEELAEQAIFYKLEAPKNRMACVELKVVSLPTFLIYRDGKEVDRLTGDIGNTELENWVSSALNNDQTATT